MKERTVRWGEEKDRDQGDKMVENIEREEEREGEMEGGREKRSSIMTSTYYFKLN